MGFTSWVVEIPISDFLFLFVFYYFFTADIVQMALERQYNHDFHC